jgi:hypothetical protein
MIRTHRTTMRVHKMRQQNLNYRDVPGRGERRNATIDDIENMLLEIESELVMDSAMRRESRSPILSTTTGSRSSDRVVYHEEERNPRTASVVEPRHPTRRHPPLQESSNESPALMTNQPMAIYLGDAPQHHHSLPNPESLSSSSGASRMRIEGDPEPGGALHSDEGNYMAVRPSDRVLRLYPGLDYQVVEGYINFNTNPTSANICDEFTENVISELCAAQLGLQIDYYQSDNEDHTDTGTGDKDRETEIDFGDSGVHSIIGRIYFEWKDSPQASGLRPLNVTCLVSPYMPLRTQLVLGQPFLRRREHYWGR